MIPGSLQSSISENRCRSGACFFLSDEQCQGRPFRLGGFLNVHWEGSYNMPISNPPVLRIARLEAPWFNIKIDYQSHWVQFEAAPLSSSYSSDFICSQTVWESELTKYRTPRPTAPLSPLLFHRFQILVKVFTALCGSSCSSQQTVIK